MRRAVLAIAVGSVFLTASACGTAKSPAGNGTPNPAAAASAGEPSGLADTRKVCENLGKVYNADIGPFADAVGKMIAGRKTTGADAAQQRAQQSLGIMGEAIRIATQTSTNAQLRADGTQTANTLNAKSEDAAYFKKIQTTQDMNTLLGPTLKEWLSPVTHHCS